MIYFTSDTHFNHDRDFVYGPRGFSSIADADETIISNWNSTVGPGDDIYVLGDFFLGSNMDYIQNVVAGLNGNIYLALGNHDTPAKYTLYMSMPNIKEVSMAYVLKHNGIEFYASHYPTLTENMNSHCVIVNLHGHTHDTQKFKKIDNSLLYNVAVDAHNNTPVSIDQIMQDLTAEGVL